jgi:hypothetical protein
MSAQKISLVNEYGRSRSGNDNLVPTANIALSFSRDALNDFFSFGTKSEDSGQSIYLFKPGDGVFLDFLHQINSGSNGGMFSLTLLDPLGEFLQTMFAYTFEDALKEIYTRKNNLGYETPTVNTQDLLTVQPSKKKDFTREERDDIVSKYSTTKLYLAYGLGTESRNWAGPFIVNISNAFYSEGLDSANKIELQFVGTDIVGDYEVKTTSNTEDYELFSVEEPLGFATVTESVQSYASARKINDQPIISQFPTTYSDLQDFGNYASQYLGFGTPFGGGTSVAGSRSNRINKSRTANVNLKFEFAYQEDPIEKPLYNLIRKYLKRLGYANVLFIVNSLDQDVSDEAIQTALNAASKTRETLFTEKDAVLESKLKRIFTTLGLEIGDLREPRSLIKESVESSEEMPQIEGQEGFDTTQIRKRYALKLSNNVKEQTVNDKFAPVMDLLKNIKTITGTGFVNRLTVENNADKIAVLNKYFPKLVPDPTSPVLIIGDDYLIQAIIYAKLDKGSIDVKLGGPGCDLTYVHAQASEGYYTEMRRIIERKKKAMAFFDFRDKGNSRIPDDFHITSKEAQQLTELGIPVFRANTDNPNVLSFVTQNQGILLSTYSSTIRQLVYFLLDASDTNEEQLKQEDIKKYVSDLFKDKARISQIANKLGVQMTDEDKLSEELFYHLTDPAFIGLTYVSESAPSVTLASYMDNFYELFSKPYKASIRTLPYYNLSEIDLINDFCLFLKNRHGVEMVADDDRVNSIYSGFWRFVGFKHVIGESDAYSEFTIIKDSTTSNVFSRDLK